MTENVICELGLCVCLRGVTISAFFTALNSHIWNCLCYCLNFVKIKTLIALDPKTSRLQTRRLTYSTIVALVRGVILLDLNIIILLRDIPEILVDVIVSLIGGICVTIKIFFALVLCIPVFI